MLNIADKESLMSIIIPQCCWGPFSRGLAPGSGPTTECLHPPAPEAIGGLGSRYGRARAGPLDGEQYEMQYFFSNLQYSFNFYLMVDLLLFYFSSLFAAIPRLQPLQEDISVCCAQPPLLPKCGQPQQECVRSPAHPPQQAHYGGADCLMVLLRS